MPDKAKLLAKLAELDDAEFGQLVVEAAKPRQKTRKGAAGKAEARRRFAGRSDSEVEANLSDGLRADHRARQGRS